MERSHDWLAQAEKDLDWARHSARGGFHNGACFAAQQAAEKAVQALIERHHILASGPSVLYLIRNLPATVSVPDEVVGGAAELDQFYIPTRYPDGFASGAPFEFFTVSQSDRAIMHAERVVEFARGNLI